VVFGEFYFQLDDDKKYNEVIIFGISFLDILQFGVFIDDKAHNFILFFNKS